LHQLRLTEVRYNTHRVLAFINTRLTHLDHLSFDGYGHIDVHQQFDMPILARLKEFYFDVPNDVNIMYHSLKQYALPNKQLKYIGLNMQCSRVEEMIEEFRHCDLRERFVSLNAMEWWLDDGENLHCTMYIFTLLMFPLIIS